MIGLLNQLAVQVNGKFEIRFQLFVESVGSPEQGHVRCFADVTNHS